MPACQCSQPTVPDADAMRPIHGCPIVLGYLYIVSQYTVRLMTPCVWRMLCLRNSSSVPYFRQPLNLPTATRRNRKCTECGTTAFGRNRLSAESAHLSTFGAETETKPKFGRPLDFFLHMSEMSSMVYPVYILSRAWGYNIDRVVAEGR